MGGAEVSLEHLYKVFTMPEGKDSKLAQIEQHLSDNLSDFLSQHVVTKVNSLSLGLDVFGGILGHLRKFDFSMTLSLSQNDWLVIGVKESVGFMHIGVHLYVLMNCLGPAQKSCYCKRYLHFD